MDSSGLLQTILVMHMWSLFLHMWVCAAVFLIFQRAVFSALKVGIHASLKKEEKRKNWMPKIVTIKHSWCCMFDRIVSPKILLLLACENDTGTAERQFYLFRKKKWGLEGNAYKVSVEALITMGPWTTKRNYVHYGADKSRWPVTCSGFFYLFIYFASFSGCFCVFFNTLFLCIPFCSKWEGRLLIPSSWPSSFFVGCHA